MKTYVVSSFLMASFPLLGAAAVTTFTDGVTIGSTNTVDATSFAVGLNNEANHSSVAFGESLSVLGWNSIAVGYTVAIDNASAGSGVFGEFSSIKNSAYSFTYGSSNSIDNQNMGFIAGSGNSSWAPSGGWSFGNVLLGIDNKINPTNSLNVDDVRGSVLIGVKNQSWETQSWVFGMGNEGQENTVILGTYNQTVANAALIVGTGTYNEATSTASRSNGLVVLRNGTVVIPSGNLELGTGTGNGVLTTSEGLNLISNHLSTNGYVKNEMTANYGVSNGGLLAIGSQAKASANASLAIGHLASATNVASTALGAGTSSTGVGSSAVGYSSQANGNASIALGATNQVDGAHSAALGYGLNVEGYRQVVIGVFNEQQIDPSTTEWLDTDYLFSVGNGSGVSSSTYSSRTNGLVMRKNGQTSLINKYWDRESPESVPSVPEASNGEALNVEGHSVLNGNAKVKGDTVLEGKVTLSQPQGDISMGIYN